MKKLIYILIAMAFPILLTGCGESFLKKNPQGSVNQEALTNETGIELLCINAYAGLNNSGVTPWQGSAVNWVLGSIYGGDANKGSDSNDQPPINDFETYNLTVTNSYLTDKWRWYAEVNKRINLALSTINEVTDLDETLKARRIGEMRFLRALVDFEAFRCWGEKVPYLDENIKDNDPRVHNDQDISPKIIADLDAAIEVLPATQPEVGRPNIWAAKAFKAKVLIYLNRKSEAKELLSDVLNNGVTSNGLKYGLEDELNNNFDAHFDNGKESIFAVQLNSSNNRGGNNSLALNFPYGSGPGGCCGFYQPSNELANSYKVDENGLPYLNNEYRNAPYVADKDPSGKYLSVNNADVSVDPRLDFTIGRIGIPYKDWGYPKNDWVRDATNGGFYMPKKFIYTKAEKDDGLATAYDGWAPTPTANYQYLSVRDMMLLYAECLAEDGEYAEAMKWVNKIRKRAGAKENIILTEEGKPAAKYLVKEYPESHPAFSNKEICIKAVRMERKLELALEGERWFDLARYGGEYMSQTLWEYTQFEKQFIAKFSVASKLQPNRTIYPIPQIQIDIMGTDSKTGTPWLVQNEVWK